MKNMRQIRPVVASIALGLLLSACSDSLSCSSDDTKLLIQDLARQRLDTAGKRLGISDLFRDAGVIELELKLLDIRTEGNDKELKKLSCAANAHIRRFVTLFNEKGRRDLSMLIGGRDFPLNTRSEYDSEDVQIKYDIQKTSEGKLYATAYGLP